jgi:hypothetical protein
MSWRAILTNARIFLGVAIGAYGVWLFIANWTDGIVNVAGPLFLLSIAALIIADPLKLQKLHREEESAFEKYVEERVGAKRRVQRGKRLKFYGALCYLSMFGFLALISKFNWPFLVALAPIVAGTWLRLIGDGEIVAVRGDYYRDKGL